MENEKRTEKNWDSDEYFEYFKNKVGIEKIIRDGRILELKEKSDYISYVEFLNYFSNLQIPITKHNLIIGINFTYGWMPTIFDFTQTDNFIPSITILNKVKDGKIPSPPELKTLKALFNNSLVGTSKLLHFINPNKMAIWDSRVYRYLMDKEPHDYRIGNSEAFLGYLKFCDYLSKQESYNEIHTFLEKKINCSMTKFRTLELIMYTSAPKPIKKSTNEPTS
jgi:hypothetical protein